VPHTLLAYSERETKVVILPDDELRQLERRFGPGVRHMGSWYSDGTFAYTSVPLIAVEQAAEALEDSGLIVSRVPLDGHVGINQDLHRTAGQFRFRSCREDC
jgi:hypothetical protein